MRIGFVGLGNVGGPMAVNLLERGFSVLGYDVKDNPAFVAAGGDIAPSLGDLAVAVQVILHSLPNLEAISASVESQIAHGGQDRVLIEMSSYGLADKLAMSDRLSCAGIAMLDCEVSGLPPQVVARSAVIFKSGDREMVERYTPVFDGIADKHFYLGENGAATRMKLIANTMVCVHNLMAAEALSLGSRVGLSPEQMIEVLGPSAAGSSTFKFKSPLMVERRFEQGSGPFRHMFGYLSRTQAMAGAAGAATPLLDTARMIYQVAEDEGRHDQDIAGIIEVVERLAQEKGHD